MPVQIDGSHYKIVKSILAKYEVTAHVFGSRAKGTAKKFSDLDLLIKENIEDTILRKLKNDFEESNLPFKVDVVSWEKIDDSFRAHIKDSLIEF